MKRSKLTCWLLTLAMVFSIASPVLAFAKDKSKPEQPVGQAKKVAAPNEVKAPPNEAAKKPNGQAPKKLAGKLKGPKTRVSKGNPAKEHPRSKEPVETVPGNNGTVKIDGVPFDSYPNNEPHVGCIFQVDFSNYDKGDYQATVTFVLQPPTGKGIVLLTDTVFIGEDPADGSVDAQVTYDLRDELKASGATAHPNQGYHLKLTVNAEGSQGSDVKHKAFWVKCKKPAPEPEPKPEPKPRPKPEPLPKPKPRPVGHVKRDVQPVEEKFLPFTGGNNLGLLVGIALACTVLGLYLRRDAIYSIAKRIRGPMLD